MNDLSDGKWSSAFTTLKQLFFCVSKTRCMNCLNRRNEPSSTSEHTSDLCVVMTKTKVLGWAQTGTLLMCQNTMCSICNPNPKRMAQIGVPRNKDDSTGNSIPRDRKVFLNGRWGKYRENKMKQKPHLTSGISPETEQERTESLFTTKKPQLLFYTLLSTPHN